MIELDLFYLIEIRKTRFDFGFTKTKTKPSLRRPVSPLHNLSQVRGVKRSDFDSGFPERVPVSQRLFGGQFESPGLGVRQES